MFIDKIQKETLLKPLQAVVGIVERKQPMPILSNVLIAKDNANITFLATDLEIQITSHLSYSSSDTDPEAITVAAKKLQEILRVVPDGAEISLDAHDGKLLVKANKSRFTLQTLPAADFPKLTEQLENSSPVELQQKLLRKLLGAVQYAMAQQDIRYYLNGVLLVLDGDQIRLVATDGHRLAYASATLSSSHPRTEVILSRKTVNELFKLLNDSDENIRLEIAEKQVRISFSENVLTTKVIDGKFPDYERVIPTYSNHLTLNRLALVQALQRAAILSNEKFRGVRFVLTEKNLKIISSNSEQEEAQEDIENDYHGPALDIGFNVNYLLDGLTNANSNEITISFGDSNSSILITIPDNTDFKYVVMPMRI